VDAFRATLEEVNRADVLVEVVDASDPHSAEHRATVQLVLDELGAGEKPRLTAYNKADLVKPAATGGEALAPVIGGSVSISAVTGFGLDTLRLGLSSLLASLWVDVDAAVPYAAGELLARVRERGTVEVEYRERDVRVRGRVAPVLAAELAAPPSAGRRPCARAWTGPILPRSGAEAGMAGGKDWLRRAGRGSSPTARRSSVGGGW